MGLNSSWTPPALLEDSSAPSSVHETLISSVTRHKAATLLFAIRRFRAWNDRVPLSIPPGRDANCACRAAEQICVRSAAS